jgi:endonuclease G
MTPQTPALNRGLWRWLEELVRTYVTQYQAVYILSGSVFQAPQRVPDGNVGIPTHFYKVLVRKPDGGDPEIIALLLPNQRQGLPVPPGTMGVQGQRITAAPYRPNS